MFNVMFSWLRPKKLKPAAAVASAARGAAGTPERATAAGSGECRLQTDSQHCHPLLSLLPPGALDRLIAGGAISEYAKGTTIYRAGDPCDAIFLIVSGRCEARRPSNGTLGKVEEVFGPGDVLGARSFLSHQAHGCSVVVVTRAVLLRIPAKEMNNLFASDPCLVGRFSHTVINRTAPLRADKPRVRRVVTLLPLAQRVDADAVLSRLAGSLRDITHQRVLVIDLRLSYTDGNRSVPLPTAAFGSSTLR